jgi:hypothetical protein
MRLPRSVEGVEGVDGRGGLGEETLGGGASSFVLLGVSLTTLPIRPGELTCNLSLHKRRLRLGSWLRGVVKGANRLLCSLVLQTSVFGWQTVVQL